jgi:uncharacterized membrane protein
MPTATFKSGRAFDRLINFSDAVVAVAITVLVLPIADISLTRGENTVWSVLYDHAGQIITFFFTFFVVSIMWLTHNRIMNQMRGYDGVIFWLNTAWLSVIAFLPVTSALYSDAGEDGLGGWFSGKSLGGAGMLYWGSLALISLISALISLHARRHAHLYDPEQKIVHTWQSNSRGWIYSIYFLSIGVVSLVSTNVSSYMPWGLILLPFVFKQGEFNNDED